MQRIEVKLGLRSYPIFIGSGAMERGDDLAKAIPARDVLLVTNTTVGPLYAQRLTAALAPRRCIEVALPDGEVHKTLANVSRMLDVLIANRFSRDACVVALGGGVVGDMAGFAAACYQRGISFVQVPTTLLAQVDSSVGGKTGVNHPGGKNLIGAFHQPAAVFADTNTLSTLPDRELRAGLAEVIKHGFALDAPFVDWLERNIDRLLKRDAAALTHAIKRSCELKAAVVAADEREAGERALLNFGHTFAHAIETEQGYGGLNHGEAVAVGMVCAAHLSARLHMAPLADAERLSALLARFGLPVALPAGLDPGALVERMRLDKKATAGALRFVLWRGAGQAEITAGVAEGDVIAAMQARPSVPVPPPPVQSPSP